MFINSAELVSSTRNYDFCIVGSGPAGMTLALELAKAGKRVCLVEGGGRKKSPLQEKFYSYQSVGEWNYFNGFGRSRFLGGSSNCWGGLCSPLDEEDFLARPWVADSGWPFLLDDLDRFFPSAGEILDTAVRTIGWKDADAHSNITQSGDEFRAKMFTLSPPTRFQEKYFGPLKEISNLEVILDFNLKSILLRENHQSVESIVFVTANRAECVIKANFFVLACGGIENSRILLNANQQMKEGLGNRYDMVGRFFMDHLYFPNAAHLFLAPEAKIPPQLLQLYVSRNPYFGYLQPTFAQQEALKLTNSAATLLMKMGKAQWFPWEKRYQDLSNYYELVLSSEMFPRASNRISLAGQKDPMGHRLAKIALSAPIEETESLKRLLRLLAIFFGRKGIGRMKIADEFEHLHGGSHHMGGTRAGNDPRKSVVDKNLQVHGIENFYLAGSSVFPTGGVANPTLNIVALSLRLKDHLISQVAKG